MATCPISGCSSYITASERLCRRCIARLSHATRDRFERGVATTDDVATAIRDSFHSTMSGWTSMDTSSTGTVDYSSNCDSGSSSSGGTSGCD